MVHHNPGEQPFESAFLDPSHLVEYGYNGQVFKHINCIATFAKLGLDLFPKGSPEREWLDRFTPGIVEEIAAAKAHGLKVFYHIDLFVLPAKLVELYRDEICGADGRISLDKPKTSEIHQILFDEIFERFPALDGLIIRVGETYLFDTPYHGGNGVVPRSGKDWTPTYLYAETVDGKMSDSNWTPAQVSSYIRLIRFLREEICVRYEKTLIFRTWDIYPDKLHAVPEHYLEVTDHIEPHEKLLFSIKHTALDFWRRVKVNECLSIGKHSQIVEVQCQREYEGKGAFPNYVMDGVINGFDENSQRIGLGDLLQSSRIKGVYSWSRGGGWYGPYIKNEFWADLNAFVLGSFAKDQLLAETDLFARFCRERMLLNDADTLRFRGICLLSSSAVLKGRQCEAFDKVLNESVLPTACWMRDDRLGGREQLHIVLKYLDENRLVETALDEKQEAVELWHKVRSMAAEIYWGDEGLEEIIKTSIEYGRLLFSIVHQGWIIMCAGFEGDRSGHYDRPAIEEAAAKYDSLWEEYRQLSRSPSCASLYRGIYFNLPGSPEIHGLDASVDYYRDRCDKI
jgi:hypothetical protein